MSTWTVERHAGFASAKWRLLLRTENEAEARELYERESAGIRAGSVQLVQDAVVICAVKREHPMRQSIRRSKQMHACGQRQSWIAPGRQ